MYKPILTHMKDIPGWEGQYAITEDGRVWSYPRLRECEATELRKECMKFYTGKWLSQATTANGYKSLSFWRDGKGYSQKVHTLVAITYIPTIEGKDIINHKNGIKTDNRVKNLEWCTHKENTQHAINTGLRKPTFGNKHGMSKMSVAKVLEARALYKRGGYTKASLGRKYGVTKTTMARIINGKEWRHVQI